jgi:hypothetical protein
MVELLTHKDGAVGACCAGTFVDPQAIPAPRRQMDINILKYNINIEPAVNDASCVRTILPVADRQARPVRTAINQTGAAFALNQRDAAASLEESYEFQEFAG